MRECKHLKVTIVNTALSERNYSRRFVTAERNQSIMATQDQGKDYILPVDTESIDFLVGSKNCGLRQGKVLWIDQLDDDDRRNLRSQHEYKAASQTASA